MSAYILYNNKAGDGDAADSAEMLEVILDEDVNLINVEKISNYRSFLTGLQPEDYIILAGGDGTINRFVNDTEGMEYDQEVLCFPVGTGNDFAHDLGYGKECNPFPITKYIMDLPRVTVNGKTYRFINGVGYGIDGYCCEVGDELKKQAQKKVNYVEIAIRGLLFHYTPVHAKVTVDGKIHTYKNVWLAPTMNGRFYGGGMMPAPEQHRNSGQLSVMVFHNTGKLKTLFLFPSLFKGKHITHHECVEILTGREITVEFDRPAPLQIDGETILNVSSYTAVC